MTKPLISKCKIGPYPRPFPEGIFDAMPSVKVQFDTGKEISLFEFYPDEISFTESEFIGLTEDEARKLKFNKDVAYLKNYAKH